MMFRWTPWDNFTISFDAHVAADHIVSGPETPISNQLVLGEDDRFSSTTILDLRLCWPCFRYGYPPES